MDQPSANSHDKSWAEEETREREVIATWDYDEQWPSVHKPPFSIPDAKQFDSRLIVLGKLGQLGRGGFGRVDKVSHGSVSLARKCIERKGRLRHYTIEDLQQEALTMRKLNHRHVVKLVGAYRPRTWEFCLLIWPAAVCDLHTLLDNLDWIRESQDDRDDILSRLNALELDDLSAIKPALNQDIDSAAKCPLDFLRGVLGCTARAMTYCHLNGIRHLDIKTTNILLKANRVYLADFGISKDVSGHEQTTIEGELGTEKWRAPEHYSKSSSMQLSDIYSLGLVYLNIATVLYNIRLAEFDNALAYPDDLSRSDKLAVREQKLRSLLQKVADSTPEAPQETTRSQRLVDLIAKMISPTPHTRLPANKINERLSILGGANQIYYNECCKHPISWTGDDDERLTTISSLRAENENLKREITELISRERIYEEQLENVKMMHEQEITKQKVLFENREKELENALHASSIAKSATQNELDKVKLSLLKLTEEHAALSKHHGIELGNAKRTIAIEQDRRLALQLKIDEPTSQKLERSKAIAAQSASWQERKLSFSTSNESFKTVADEATWDGLPWPVTSGAASFQSQLRRGRMASPEHIRIAEEDQKKSANWMKRFAKRANRHKRRVEP